MMPLQHQAIHCAMLAYLDKYWTGNCTCTCTYTCTSSMPQGLRAVAVPRPNLQPERGRAPKPTLTGLRGTAS